MTGGKRNSPRGIANLAAVLVPEPLEKGAKLKKNADFRYQIKSQRFDGPPTCAGTSPKAPSGSVLDR